MRTNSKRTRRKRTSNVRKSNVRKSKIHTVHQIFYNIGRGELHEIPAFEKCYLHNKKYCKKHKAWVRHKLWDRDMVEELLNKPKNKKYKKIYHAFDQDIQRIDFARYMILWNHGGIYIDLDICIMKKSIKHLFKKPYFFVKWHTSHLPYNALLGTRPNTKLFEDILDHCEESYYEKKKQKIYKQWKGRFVFQTTGHYMLQRVLKKHKITHFEDIMKVNTKEGNIVCDGPIPKCPNALFEDSSASVWYSKK